MLVIQQKQYFDVGVGFGISVVVGVGVDVGIGVGVVVGFGNGVVVAFGISVGVASSSVAVVFVLLLMSHSPFLRQ